MVLNFLLLNYFILYKFLNVIINIAVQNNSDEVLNPEIKEQTKINDESIKTESKLNNDKSNNDENKIPHSKVQNDNKEQREGKVLAKHLIQSKTNQQIKK